jgi:hypothetical protein
MACYSRKLRRELSSATLPRHVGLIMDGNRRWARQTGLASPSLGHKYGAEHVEDVLNWCERAGIRHVTVPRLDGHASVLKLLLLLLLLLLRLLEQPPAIRPAATTSAAPPSRADGCRSYWLYR